MTVLHQSNKIPRKIFNKKIINFLKINVRMKKITKMAQTHMLLQKDYQIKMKKLKEVCIRIMIMLIIKCLWIKQFWENNKDLTSFIKKIMILISIIIKLLIVLKTRSILIVKIMILIMQFLIVLKIRLIKAKWERESSLSENNLQNNL